MLDGMDSSEMSKILKEFDIKSPMSGNDLSEPIDFNLMFQTEIGPTGMTKGFLRPETAQGSFRLTNPIWVFIFFDSFLMVA